MAKMNHYIYFMIFVFGLCPRLLAQTCDSTAFNRTNLGLYGGAPTDLSFSSSGRLFAAVEAPTSLYYSDDTANTWIQAFPIDSLEFECGQRGWGGNGMKVLANTKKWILAYTKVNAIGPQENRTSCELSFNDGDTTTWRTFIDEYLIEQLTGAPNQAINNIAITDHKLYAITNNMIIQSDSVFNYTITDTKIAMPYLTYNHALVSIAVSNNSQGIPYYITIDTIPSNGNSYDALLFKYDGSVFTKLSLPLGNIKGCREVFVHPTSITGDTLFITSDDSAAEKRIILRSVDGGLNWTDISFSKTFIDLQEIDYSNTWKSQISSGNGAILIIGGVALSYDLGNTWQAIAEISDNAAVALHPNDTSIVMGTKAFVHLSTMGSAGTFTARENTGMEAVKIIDIASNSDKSMFYLATSSGLAYTKAYSDTAVTPVDKWKTPYGNYPLDMVQGIIEGISIDPSDSLHVVAAGQSGYIYMTTSGPDNFSNVFDAHSLLSDIEFISSSIVIAAGDSLFLSDNGGTSWANITPAGFSNANVIAVAKSATDTVIYIGTGEMDIAGTQINDTAYLWQSFDYGYNWAKSAIGPGSMNDTAAKGIKIIDIAIIAGTTDSMFMIAGNEGYKSVVFSPNGGSTYEYLNIVDSFYSYSSLLIADPDSSVLIAAGRRIHEYNPALDSSHVVYVGLPSEEIPKLYKGSILVGTSTGFYSIGFEPLDDITVGIKKIVSQNSSPCTLFPNPVFIESSSPLAFKNCQLNGSVQISMADVYGKVICKKSYPDLNNVMIPMNSFRPGTYMLTILNKDGCFTQKIILL